MSYFENGYQKRLTKNGKTRQDIIKTHKEHEFDMIYMKRTAYLSTIYEINGAAADIEVSWQKNRWNENAIINNILMSTSEKPLKTGDVFNIRMEVKGKVRDEIMIVVFVEKDLMEGYQLFKTYTLDIDLNITDEYGNSIHSAPAKIINASQSIMQDTISRSLKELGYREPGTTRIIITQSADEVKKGAYFNYQNRGWEIIGIDDLSVPNVTYVFFAERLKREEEPISSEQILVGHDTNFFLNGR